MIQNTVRPLINEHCHLGENPLWNAREQRLYWTDIGAGKIHRFDPQGGRHEIIYEGVPVGGFTFQANGDLLLFRIHDIAVRYPRASKKWVWCQEEPLNMGAWSYISPRLEATLGTKIRYAGRGTASSPATGSKTVHYREQKEVLVKAFSI